MKFSQYNYLFKSDKFGFLLYNSETNSFAELQEELYETLQKIQSGQLTADTLPADILSQLEKAKVFTNNDDSFYLQKKFYFYRRVYNTSRLGFALAPTTFCNFNCPYCYEENRLPVFMTEETENHFMEFIKKYKNIEAVDIIWYGGEPLANFKSIKNILRKISQDSTIKLGEHGIVTNGFLLDEEKSKFFQEYPLNFIQITIDGLKNSHDQRRILKDGTPTYDKILHNIDTFFEYNKQTRVSIRVNIDAANSDDFVLLYNELTERWKGKNIDVHPAFVGAYTKSCSEQCSVLHQDERIAFYMNLYEKHGLNVRFYPDFQIGGCCATNINYYVVGPRGELYKCWNDIGIETRIVGYLDKDDIPNKNLLTQYLVGPSMFDDEECKKCVLFPVCGGGCQWLRLKNTYEEEKFSLCSHRKNHLDKFLEMHYVVRKEEKNKK